MAECNAVNMSLLLNLTNKNFLIFLSENLPILNPYLPQKSENLRPHSSNSIDPIFVTPVVKMRPHPGAHPQWPLVREYPCPPPGKLASSKSGVRPIIREMGLTKASKWGKGREGGGGSVEERVN